MKSILIFNFLIFLSLQVSFGQQLLWERGFNYGPNDDAFLRINIINDSTIIAGGAANSTFYSFYAQYQINGTKNWHKYSRRLRTGEQDIQPFNKGYFYTAAVRNYLINGGSSVMLQRLSPLGDTLWTKVYSGFREDYAYRMQIKSNSIYITGVGFNKGTYSYTLFKTDTMGVLQWRKFYTPVFGAAYPCDLLIRPNGNLVISGMSQTANMYARLHLVEVNPNGDSLRSATISFKSPNLLAHEDHYRASNNFSLTADGNYICSGTIDSATYKLGYIAKIDTSFNVLWHRIVRPQASQNMLQTSKVIEIPNGSFALLANNESPQNNTFYVYTFSANGQYQGQTSYASTLCSRLRILDWKLLADGSGIAAGRCFSNGEAYIARFGSLLSSKLEGINAQKALGQSYPNPTAAEAIIPYNLPKSYQKARIIIREIATGREVKSYAVRSNESSLKVDLSNFSNGLYLYSLVVDEMPIATRKLVVMK